MLEAIIFDMDGVLFDSPKYVWKSFNKILESYNVHVGREKQKKYMGRSLRDQIALIKKDFGIDEEFDLEEVSDRMNEIQLELMGGSIDPNQQILDLVEEAKGDKVKVGVATSSTRKRAEELLEMVDILNKLDHLVTAEDIEKHKPSPDIYIKAAKKARIKVVGFETDYHSEKELSEADLIISNFSEVNLVDLKQVPDTQ